MIHKAHVQGLKDRIDYLDKIVTRFTFQIVKQNATIAEQRRLIRQLKDKLKLLED